MRRAPAASEMGESSIVIHRCRDGPGGVDFVDTSHTGRDLHGVIGSDSAKLEMVQASPWIANVLLYRLS